MANLPVLKESLVTSAAPQSSVSRQDIISNTNMMARALSDVADATMEIATKQAKEQAAEDLSQQKVVRGADGEVSTVNPASSVIFGKAGEVYSEAVKAGTIAQTGNIVAERMNELHREFPTSPDKFKAASEAFLDKYIADNPGQIGAMAVQRGRDLASQHFNSITNTTANLDVTNQQKSINATIADQKNTLQGLARQPGGSDTPEFRGALERLQASYQALTTNPLFKMPQDQVDLELKNFRATLQGEALVAHVDETFNRKGKADAQAVLSREILQNPNLSEADRTRLYTQGMSRLSYLTGDAKEKIDAGRKVTEQLETNIASGAIKPTDPIIGMEIRQARDRGDPESANRILAAAQVRLSLSGVSTLPQAVQSEVLGINKTGVANREIPAEGRALLDLIAGTESAGRYNVRYGGATFQDFRDHPRIYEPIISGPDVGKTSSAAGRYQFIGSTWDQQAKKLGLKDFSPENQDAAAWDLAQTEYKAKTGRDLLSVLRSGDQAAIADVPRNLSAQWSSLPGGRQPAAGGPVLAPAAAPGRPGFTAADLQRNPFLGSAYVRTIAADESLRVQAATQAATGVEQAVSKGLLPSPEAVALVNQTAAQYPEKFGTTAEKMNGQLLGPAIARLPKPERDQVIAAYREATNGQDQHHMNVAAAALDQYQKSEDRLRDKPYQEAATRGWINPVAPIDPGQPGTVAGALGERVAASQRIAAMNHTPPPPVIGKDEMPQLQAALDGPAGADVLGQIATVLKPDEINRLVGEKGFANALTGMMSSKDPVKMSAAMSVVDRLWRDNPAVAESSLGAPAVTKLQAWQGLKGSFNAVELAERLNAADDPSTVKARETAKDAAEKETKSLTPSDMAYKLGTGWYGIGRLTGSTPAAPFDSIKGGELVADYQSTYTALRTYGVEASQASDLAVQRLQSTWGVSQAAGNQIMKNPPERAYPQVDGSHEWLKQDLDGWITKRAGAQFTAGPRTLEVGIAGVAQSRNWDVAGMIADGQTQAEIAGGRPASYQVAIRRKDGTLDILPGRVAFDPADHISKYGARLQKRAQAAGMQASGDITSAPFGVAGAVE